MLLFSFSLSFFAHCAWRCLMFLLGPPLAPRITWNIVPSKRSAAVRPPCRTCYSGYPASPLESVEKVPLLRGSYIIFKLPLLMSFLTPHSLFAFTETYAGMVVLSETIRRGQFAKPRQGASFVSRNRCTFPKWWDWSLIFSLIESRWCRMSNLIRSVNLTLTLSLSYWDGENSLKSVEGSQRAMNERARTEESKFI